MALTDMLKEVVNLARKINNIELYQKIIELQMEFVSLIDENQRLRDEVATLKDKFDIHGDLQAGKNSYWRLKGARLDGPFCTCCWDTHRNLVRLHEQPSGPQYTQCPSCKSYAKVNGPL